MNWQVLFLAILVLSLTACAAQRPVLYPNERYKSVGKEVAQQDIDQCIQSAQLAGADTGGNEAAGQAAESAAVGGAVGAGYGAVRGDLGTSAAAGAAAAGAGSLMRSAIRSRDSNPVQRGYVDRCLREKGYDPIGWR